MDATIVIDGGIKQIKNVSNIKGFRSIAIGIEEGFDNSGKPTRKDQLYMYMQISSNSLKKVDSSFGKDLLLRGKICTSLGDQYEYLEMTDLSKYLRVFFANGGVAKYDPSRWIIHPAGFTTLSNSNVPDSLYPPALKVAAPSKTPSSMITRPSTDPVVQGVPKLYTGAKTVNGGDGAACAQLNSLERIKNCTVEVTQGGIYTWGSAWCSSTPASFKIFMQSVHVQFEVDGQKLNNDQFWIQTTDRCIGQRVIVKGPPPGKTHQFKIIVKLAKMLKEGHDISTWKI